MPKICIIYFSDKKNPLLIFIFNLNMQNFFFHLIVLFCKMKSSAETGKTYRFHTPPLRFVQQKKKCFIWSMFYNAWNNSPYNITWIIHFESHMIFPPLPSESINIKIKNMTLKFSPHFYANLIHHLDLKECWIALLFVLFILYVIRLPKRI